MTTLFDLRRDAQGLITGPVDCGAMFELQAPGTSPLSSTARILRLERRRDNDRIAMLLVEHCVRTW